MQSRILGTLKQNENIQEWFESIPFEIPYFNNKRLKITFTEAEHKRYMDAAEEVLMKFLNLNEDQRIIDADIVHKYYWATLSNGLCESLEIKSVEDIWDYVTPSEIIIDWDEHANFFLNVSCNCAWEEEQGLLLVFKNGEKLTRASGHDGHYID